MKEQYMQSHELTRRSAYSTLNRTRPFERVLFTMDQKPPEKPTGSHRADGSSKDAAMRRKMQQDQMSGERFMGNLLGTLRNEGNPAKNSPDQADLSRLILERMASQTTQDEAEAQRALQDVMGGASGSRLSPYKYDAFNEVDVIDPPTAAGGGEEGGGPPRRRRMVDAGQEFNVEYGAITHPELTTFIDEINDLNNLGRPEQMQGGLIEALWKVQELPDRPEDREYMMQKNMLEGRINTEIKKFSARHERIGLYLQEDDREQLLIDPLGWLDKKFDQVYGIAMSGQELDSQVLQGMQSLVGEASQFLSRRFEKAFDAGELESREKFEKFIDMFNKMYSNRINLLITRTNIDQKNMENVVGAYGRLRTEGLLGSLAFDGNKVGTMFNRILDYMETIRMAHGGDEQHITPVMMKKLQATLEQEQLDFAKGGIGIFKDEYIRAKERAQEQVNKVGEGDVLRIADSFLRAEIRRAIRTAYDVAVSSQQVAVRSARGKDLKTKLDAFSSDVVGAFGFLNAQAFLVDKFNILNDEQEDFFRYTQMHMAESEAFNAKSGESVKTLTTKQLMERGRRMWRDMDAAPDFFSSGWRIKGMLQQIEDVTKYKIQNEEIVKGLLDGQGSDELKKKYERYVKAYKVSSKWRVLLESRENEQAANAQIARDFAQGVLHTDINDLSAPPGMTLTERNEYIQAHNLDNEEITQKAKEVSSNLGLFLRLKNPEASTQVLGQEDDKAKIWKRIQKFKPEEMMRVMRERLDPHDPNDARTLNQLNNVFSDAGGSYDEFKIKYGAIVHAVREEAMLNGSGQPLDIRDLNKPEYAKQKKQILDSFRNKQGYTFTGREVDELVGAFGKLDGFVARNDVVNKLLYSWQYEDVYKRTLLVDDAILSQLEYVQENSGLEKLSQIYSGEAGGDALKRNGNDFMNYAAASGFKVGVISKEGFDNVIKDAEQLHQKVAAYEGPDAGARAFYSTAGAFMRYSLQDHWADLLQVGKLPFRMASSEIERKFGYGQKPITAEDARQKLDHISAFLTGRGGHDAHKYYHLLEKQLRADGASIFKDKAITISIYMMLLLMLLPAAAAGKAVSEATH